MRVEVDLGSLKPDDVVVELIVGHGASGQELSGRANVPLSFVEARDDVNVFEGVRAMDRSGSYSYGIRVRVRTDREYSTSLRDLVLWA